MLEYSLHCNKCTADLGRNHAARCPACGGVLLIKPHLAEPPFGLKKIFNFELSDMWKYRDLLPVEPPPEDETLREGGTPLLVAPTIAGLLGIKEVLLKNETVNPTGSFKDRQVAVGLAAAQDCHVVVVISSGNVAAAAAAQAARRGLRCLVFVPVTAPQSKLVQAAVCGAQIFRINTGSSSLVMQLVVEASARRGWCHLSTAGCFNPFSVEGSKTIAYELYEQGRGILPDWIFVPVGGGGLLGGLWRGLLDLQELGLAKGLPHLAGVQAAGCAPLIKALAEDLDPDAAMAARWDKPHTIAGGLADDVLFDAHRALPAIRCSGGTAVAVSDQSILEAMGLLAKKEGIFAEPSGAASLAGLMALRKTGLVKADQRVCCLVTGSGLKDIAAAESIANHPVTVEPELEAVIRAVEA